MMAFKTLLGSAALLFAGAAYAQGAAPADKPKTAEAPKAEAAAAGGCKDCASGCCDNCGGGCAACDAHNPWKLSIPMGGEDKAMLGFFASYRARGELRIPFSYSAGARNEDTATAFRSRLRLGVDACLPEHMGFRLELQDVRNFGDEPNGATNVGLNSGSTGLDVLQAFVTCENLWDSGWNAMLGRQKFNIGHERLWSTNEFSAGGRAWDGLRFTKRMSDDVAVQGFALLVNDGARAGDAEYDLGASIKVRGEKDFEFEGFFLNQIRQVPVGALPNANKQTWSLRADGTCPLTGLRTGGELVMQTGTEGPRDTNVLAFAFAVNAGYTVAIEQNGKKTGDLSIDAGWDWASGDSSPTDNIMRTFRAPFTASHTYIGQADVLGWSNIHDYHLSLLWDTGNDWTLRLAGHFFRRASSGDGIYDTNGNLMRAGFPGQSRNVGTELDMAYRTQVNKWAWVELSWNIFFAGQFLKDSRNGVAGDGGNQAHTTHYLWATLNVTF